MSAPIHTKRRLETTLLAHALVASACGGGSPTTDAARMDDAGGLPEANIREALACGTPLGVSGTAAAGELQLHQVDTARFPDALCNDGTAAVLYYRPYRGEENRDRWAITLRGGGSCGNAETCAARWCSCAAGRPCEHTDVVTNFTLDNMSGGGRRGNRAAGSTAAIPRTRTPSPTTTTSSSSTAAPTPGAATLGACRSRRSTRDAATR